MHTSARVYQESWHFSEGVQQVLNVFTSEHGPPESCLVAPPLTRSPSWTCEQGPQLSRSLQDAAAEDVTQSWPHVHDALWGQSIKKALARTGPLWDSRWLCLLLLRGQSFE
ncbi:g11204 [Coccomyxa viridis]|uniref:G11204 protein n=1 Tax=Coccomyxa viridis TaxID=1274662 RepID=A0ABP1G8K1_9CHLO